MTQSPAPLMISTEKHGIGIALAATAFGMFSILDFIVKHLTGFYPVPQILSMHCLFSLIPILIYASLRGGILSHVRTKRPGMHLLRVCCTVSSGLCGTFAVSQMAVADFYAFTFAAPLFITALSVPILREAVGWRRWTAVAVGFCGILIMLRPGAGVIDVAALLALGAALFYASGMILARGLRATESSASFAIYSCIAGFLANLPATTFLWTAPSWPHLGLSFLGGIIGGSALIALLTAFQRSPAAIVAPFQYSQMIWGIVLGYLLNNHVPEPDRMMGAAIVIGSGLYILYRETLLGRGAATKRVAG